MSSNKQFKIQNGVGITGTVEVGGQLVIDSDGKVVLPAISDTVSLAIASSSTITDLQIEDASIRDYVDDNFVSDSDLAATNARTAGISVDSDSQIVMGQNLDMNMNQIKNVWRVYADDLVADRLDLDNGGTLNAKLGTVDFEGSTVNFGSANVGGLGSTINDQVDVHLNQSSAGNNEFLKWNGTDYEFTDYIQGRLATNQLSVDIGGSINAEASTLDFSNSLVNFSGATINGFEAGSVETDALTVDGDASVTGDLTLLGSLNLSGGINQYNVTDLDVADKTITVGHGQLEAQSGGSGIVVDGSGASMLWNQSNQTWDLNKSLDVTGTATMDGGSISGNLLIGASSASAKLTVGTFGDTARAAQFHGGSVLIDGGAATELLMGDGNVAYMSLQTTDNATAMKIRDYSGNADLVTVERASGNVGIGCSPPTGVRTKIKGLDEATNLSTSATSASLFIEPYSGSSWGLGIGSVTGQKQYIQAVSAAGDGTKELLLQPFGGNVGIGNSSPVEMLTIGSTSDTNVRVQLMSSTTGAGTIQFADGTGASAYSGYINYTHSDNALAFATGSSERMRITGEGDLVKVGGVIKGERGTASAPAYSFSDDTDTGIFNIANADLGFAVGGSERMRISSAGDLLVGKTSTNIAVAGCRLGSFGAILTRGDGSEPLRVNRTGSDGEIIKLDKDGTTLGSIGVQGSRPYFGNSINFSIKCDDANSGSLVPSNQSGVPTNNVADIGLASNRWNDLYLGGGVHLGGTGAANKLDDYEEGTWTPTSGVALTVNQATYTKIGRMVHIIADIQFATSSSGSGASISLPFAGVVNSYNSGSMNYTTYTNNVATVDLEPSGVYFRANQTGNILGYASVSDKRFIFSATYFTTL